MGRDTLWSAVIVLGLAGLVSAAGPTSAVRDKAVVSLRSLYVQAEVIALGVIVGRDGDRAQLEVLRVLAGPQGLSTRLEIDVSDGGLLCDSSSRATEGALVLALLEPLASGAGWRFVHAGSGLMETFVADGRVYVQTDSVSLPDTLRLVEPPRSEEAVPLGTQTCVLQDVLADITAAGAEPSTSSESDAAPAYDTGVTPWRR